MLRTKYFDVTVFATNAEELNSIAEELRLTRIHNLLYVGERTGCGSFRLWSETYSPTHCHFLDVSAAFPSALFLVEVYDVDSYTHKLVLHGGQLLCETSDDSRTQGGIWVLPNIFEPFRAEYELGLPVGSLWDEWVRDLSKAVTALQRPHGAERVHQEANVCAAL